MISFNANENDTYEKLLKRQNYIHNDIFCTEKIIEQLKIPINSLGSGTSSISFFITSSESLDVHVSLNTNIYPLIFL